MTVTIPRPEIDAIAARYNDAFTLTADPTAEWVRGIASGYREDAGPWGSTEADALRAEADELDALVDRYEQESNT